MRHHTDTDSSTTNARRDIGPAADFTAGLRALADLLEQRPDLLDTGYLSLSLHPGAERMDLWADALREARIGFRDDNGDHSRTIASTQLAGLAIVSVHDEPYRRYLAGLKVLAQHQHEVDAVLADELDRQAARAMNAAAVTA